MRGWGVIWGCLGVRGKWPVRLGRSGASVGANPAYFFLAILHAPALVVPASAAFWELESVRVPPT